MWSLPDMGQGRICRVRLTCAAIVGMLFACFSIGCAGSRRRATDTITSRVSDPDGLVQILTQHLPPGASLASAQEFMEREGFECTVHREDTFQQQVIDSNGLKTSEPVEGDFLRCVRRHTKRLVTTVTSVAIFLEGDVVTEIMAKEEFIGP